MHVRSFRHKVGSKLHPAYYSYLEQKPATEMAWFEATTEDYLEDRGRPFEVLKKIRQEYPLAFHGVSLNIGSPEGVSISYLQSLRDLLEQFEPFIVSDHLCWTGTTDWNTHDLLPLPFTEDSISTVINNIDFVQTFLRRPLVLENISTFLSYRHNEMNEWDFAKEVSERSGCGILLDINNIYTNAINYGFNPHYLLNHISLDRVAQIHFSAPHLAEDTPDPLWQLFKILAPQIRHLPVLVEQLDQSYDFATLESEVRTAVTILENFNETERSTESV